MRMCVSVSVFTRVVVCVAVSVAVSVPMRVIVPAAARVLVLGSMRMRMAVSVVCAGFRFERGFFNNHCQAELAHHGVEYMVMAIANRARQQL